MAPARVSILKIGGSLITDKARDCTFRHKCARRLADEVAAVGEPLVVLHGTGSFGKPPARRFRYMDGFLSRQRAPVVSQVEGMLDDLRGQFVQVLRAAGVPAYPLTATTLFRTSRGEISACTAEALRKLLDRGLCPVVSGAIVVDEQCDFAVLSSDLMASALATALPAQRLIFATDVPGLMISGTAEPLPLLNADDVRLASWLDDGGEDVSAGMRGKLTAGFRAARAGVVVQIVDGHVPGRVLQALSGHTVVSTRLVGPPSVGATPRRRASRLAATVSPQGNNHRAAQRADFPPTLAARGI
jgi:isopentenyl phosphate kinase